MNRLLFLTFQHECMNKNTTFESNLTVSSYDLMTEMYQLREKIEKKKYLKKKKTENDSYFQWSGLLVATTDITIYK